MSVSAVYHYCESWLTVWALLSRASSQPDFWGTSSLCLCPIHGWWVLFIHSYIHSDKKKTLLVLCTAIMSCRLSGGVTALLPNMFASCFLHGHNGIKLVDRRFSLRSLLINANNKEWGRMSLAALATVQVLPGGPLVSTLHTLAVPPFCISPLITINAPSHCNDGFYNNGP